MISSVSHFFDRCRNNCNLSKHTPHLNALFSSTLAAGCGLMLGSSNFLAGLCVSSLSTMSLAYIRNKIYINPETGLKGFEDKQIDDFIKTNLPSWKQKFQEDQNLKTFRIEKEDSHLPRTIHIIRKDNDNLHVMVLCKRKEVKEVGRGKYKNVTRAIDWQSKKMWAFAVLYNDYNKEHDIEMVARTHPLRNRVVPDSIGHIHYRNKEGFFTPLREGNLSHLFLTRIDPYKTCISQKMTNSVLKKFSFITNFLKAHFGIDLKPTLRLTVDQKLKLMEELIQALYLLEQKKIEHRDIKPDNILYYEQDDWLHIELADFGLAIQDKTDMSKNDVERKRNPEVGSKFFFPPEKIRCEHLLEYFKDKKVSDTIMDKSGRKHDVWPLGLILLVLMTEDNSLLNLGHHFTHRRVVKMMGYGHEYLKNDELFCKAGSENQKAPFQEPEKETFMHLIWQMLQIDYRQRISPTELLTEFNRLKASYA